MLDTVLVVPLYPYWIEEDSNNVDLEDCWTAWPKLFFSCHLCQKGRRMPKDWRHIAGPDYLRYDLVFLSTFKELTFPIKGPMDNARVIKLYEPSPTPCLHRLYVALAANMVGRIPLMPCFLDGNATLTIPHKYSKNKNSCFPVVCADAAAEDGRLGSNVYEVNTWDLASLSWAA